MAHAMTQHYALGPVNTNSIRSAGACIFRMKGIFGVV